MKYPGHTHAMHYRSGSLAMAAGVFNHQLRMPRHKPVHIGAGVREDAVASGRALAMTGSMAGDGFTTARSTMSVSARCGKVTGAAGTDN